MEKSNFITFLDEYKDKQEVTNNEYIKFIQQVYADFYSNNYGSPDTTGYCPTINNTNQYELWKSSYEIKIDLDDIREEKIIDIDVNDISDLLKIINENEYEYNFRYNIDLKALHNIKTELENLNNMVGLENMKTNIVDQLLYFLQGLHTIGNGDYKHTILHGPPGTGKTEVAKIMGTMYSKIGILKNNIFRKVTRSDLIAGYLGQTALKTKKVIEECLGGVLFIDEVYSLGSPMDNDNYSKECIDTICECLSDNKDNLMVIVAGYENEINERFLKMNSGLESRFIWKFEMDRYSYNDLCTIFIRMVKKNNWCIDNEEVVEEWFKQNFEQFKSYGRDIEKLFSYVKIAHGRRIYGKKQEDKYKITIIDLNKGLSVFKENSIKKNELPKYIQQTMYC
jgi:SpoVK/Ycf46/Vps4 family AAA+-type ATPase